MQCKDTVNASTHCKYVVGLALKTNAVAYKCTFVAIFNGQKQERERGAGEHIAQLPWLHK